MPTRGRAFLVVGGALTLGIGLLHVAIAIIGPTAYRYFGAGERMARLASEGSPQPTLITLLMAAMFGLCGLYALSAAVLSRRLPFRGPALIFIGGIFALRGLLVIPETLGFLRHTGSVPVREVVFSAAALVVGALYLIGVALNRQEIRRRAEGIRHA